MKEERKEERLNNNNRMALANGWSEWKWKNGKRKNVFKYEMGNA